MVDAPTLPENGNVETLWWFVDEAGDPTLFNSAGKEIVGTHGCSTFFLLGRLEVDDPRKLSGALSDLRNELLADPYFAGVESFRPERKKTALAFHAKDDVQEVRYRVLRLLAGQGKSLRFHAVVCDKRALAERERAHRAADPRYRFNPDHIYDGLIRQLFSKFHGIADRYEVCVSKRGQKDRNQAIRIALEHAEADFVKNFGFSRGKRDDWRITVSNPRAAVCLQAADYFLWALQRFFESRQNETTGESLQTDRFLNLLWSQVAEIHDLDFGPAYGTFFGPQNPLTLAARFPEKAGKQKKP